MAIPQSPVSFGAREGSIEDGTKYEVIVVQFGPYQTIVEKMRQKRGGRNWRLQIEKRCTNQAGAMRAPAPYKKMILLQYDEIFAFTMNYAKCSFEF
jgi:hypothetical protein